jgi:hypothetical protein
VVYYSIFGSYGLIALRPIAGGSTAEVIQLLQMPEGYFPRWQTKWPGEGSGPRWRGGITPPRQPAQVGAQTGKSGSGSCRSRGWAAERASPLLTPEQKRTNCPRQNPRLDAARPRRRRDRALKLMQIQWDNLESTLEK